MNPQTPATSPVSVPTGSPDPPATPTSTNVNYVSNTPYYCKRNGKFKRVSVPIHDFDHLKIWRKRLLQLTFITPSGGLIEILNILMLLCSASQLWTSMALHKMVSQRFVFFFAGAPPNLTNQCEVLSLRLTDGCFLFRFPMSKPWIVYQQSGFLLLRMCEKASPA